MYLFLLGGFCLDFKNIRLYKRVNPVYLLYLYILLRNLSFEETKIINYWLPNFFTFLLFAILAGYVVKDAGNINKMMQYIYMFLSILMALGCVKILYSRERLAVFGGPNGYYKFALFFAGVSFVNYLFDNKKRYIIFVVIGLVLSLFTGSKGAIVTICVLIPILYWYYMAKNNTSVNKMLKNFAVLAGITLIIIIIGVIAIYKIPFLRQVFNRAIVIFSSDASGLTSVTSRTKLLELSWGYFIESPLFGKGAQYLMLDTALTDNPQPYAHNIFFELLGEQGIIGFIIFFTVLLLLIKYLKKKYIIKNRIYADLYIGFLIYFIGAQFSGNILDSKVCLFFALSIIVYRKKMLESYEVDFLTIKDLKMDISYEK